MRNCVRGGVHNAVQLAQLVGRQAVAFAVVDALMAARVGISTLGIAAIAMVAAMTAAMATSVAAAVTPAVSAPIAVAIAGKGRLLEIEGCQSDRRNGGDQKGGQK